MLNFYRDEIKKLMKNDVKEILTSVRNMDNIVDGHIPAVDKTDGSPVTDADIKIGKLFVNKLTKMLPGSVVINEEDFNEDVYENVKKSKYVWIVDPIDGTRAFCDINNKKYCVGVALFESMRPVLSVLYIPEFEINGNVDFIIEAIDTEEGIRINEKLYNVNEQLDTSDIKYVCHVQKDTELNDIEKIISAKCGETEKIKSNFGHSTLINYVLVATSGLARAFSKREVNIWDIVQSAYIVEKVGGKVFYQDGTDIFPLDLNRLRVKDNKLILPFTIAGAEKLKSVL